MSHIVAVKIQFELSGGFPNKVQWKNITESDSINLPDVVKDYIRDKDNNSLPPVCYPLEYDKDTETALTSFNDIDRYFSESSRLDLEPYVLSQKEVAGSHQSTTKCILHLRYGTRYQMRVEYFNSKELQEQLFELYTMEEDSKHVNCDVKEKAEVCLRERYEILTGHEFTQEDSVNSFKDIKLSKDVLKFAGKTELYIGRGEDCTIDRLALQVDAVILVTEFGFTICEKEVKDMLTESGFLQRCDKDPSNNKIMLIAYPEKNLKWQFAKKGKNKIEKLEVESKKKKDTELETIAKILNKNSNDLEKNIFTTYLLPVLHSSILSQKDAQNEHEVISKHSDFLKYTGIMDFLIQLDEFVLSKQKSSFDHVKTRLKHFQRVLNNITKEIARTIVLYLNNKEFQLQLNEKIQRLNDQLKGNMDKMLIGYVADLVEKMLFENIPGAKEEWSAQKNKVTSVGVYSPYFCGKNPIHKVRLFHVIFGGLEVTKKQLFDKILEQIDKILEEFKSDVIKVCITELNAFLKPKGILVQENFVLQAINDKLLDVQQG
ncbi:uncharacterized protein [Pyxicephalus adspersus]|uniref:uncharacterized protein n=1 Tax=Pyxicephalus adspersus TaxID=30357 RepID=UPI003B5BD487